MPRNYFFFFILLSFTVNIAHAQCDLIIKYDEAGNRIFRGTPCDPDCSIKVSNTDDTGNGSLRKAVFCAEDGDVIWFSGFLEDETIFLSSGPIEIDKDIEISTHEPPPISDFGPLAPITVNVESISDNMLFRIIPNVDVTIHGLNMLARIGYDGDPTILLNDGYLIMKDFQMTEDGDMIDQGSAVYNNGTIDIIGITKLLYEN